MKAIAINASPRKSWNTAGLLESALSGAKEEGADVRKIDLIDLKFSGCISCFSCKRLQSDGETTRMCAVNDGLKPVLEEILSSDVLFIGSPIYIGDVTGLFRNLFERLMFMLISYGKYHDIPSGYHIACGLFYTTNAPGNFVTGAYQPLFDGHAATLKRVFNEECRTYAATETLQFEDYSIYDSTNFNVEERKKRHEEVWPADLAAAKTIGAQLVSHMKNLKA